MLKYFSSNGKRGFTVAEIMVAASIIALLAAIALPSLRKARKTAQEQLCICSMRKLDDAMQQWALEKDIALDTVVDIRELEEYLGKSFRCPVNNVPYVVTTVRGGVTCTNHPYLPLQRAVP